MGAAISSSISAPTKRRFDIAFPEDTEMESEEIQASDIPMPVTDQLRNFAKGDLPIVDHRLDFHENRVNLFDTKDIGVQTWAMREDTSKFLPTQRRKFDIDVSPKMKDHHNQRSPDIRIKLVELKDIGIQTLNLSAFATIELVEKVVWNIASFLDDTDFKSFLFTSRAVNGRLAPLFFRRVGMMGTQLAKPAGIHAPAADEAMRCLVVETRIAFALLMAWRRSRIRHSLTSASFSFSGGLDDIGGDIYRLKSFFISLPIDSEFQIKRIILKFASRWSAERPAVIELMNVIYRTQCEEFELIGPTENGETGGQNMVFELGRRPIDYGGVQIVTTMHSFTSRSGTALTLNILEWTLAHLVANKCLTHLSLTNTGLAQKELDKGLGIANVPNLQRFEIEDASLLGLIVFLRRHRRLEHIAIHGTDEAADNVPGFNALVDSLELPSLRSISATPSTAECIVGACTPQTLRRVVAIKLMLAKNGFFDSTGFLRFLNSSSISRESSTNLRTLDVTLAPLNRFLSPLFGHNQSFEAMQRPNGINHVVARFSTDLQIHERIAVLVRNSIYLISSHKLKTS
ncbi:hypothetical protein SCHPADRAFT_761051 [Schizopora paradoxa]|uniref:RNI-like protein n=1 Tax=Schizopora paradoxa TaxID=27342 RepID=A0A0H2QYR6_9AGAM|nr:hypothetical protein SCHPADRAFT_761051 [Schizopora paradoxa]